MYTSVDLYCGDFEASATGVHHSQALSKALKIINKKRRKKNLPEVSVKECSVYIDNVKY